MDARSAPEAGFRPQASNEVPDVGLDAWPAWPPARASAPPSRPPAAMPPGDGRRVGIEPRRAHFVIKTKSRFLGPPCNPGRSDFPIPVLVLAFPERPFRDREAEALARIHPTCCGLPLGSSSKSWLLRLAPLTILGPPSTQSSCACRERDSWQDGVTHHLGGHYPSFIAPTSSCAKPVPSAGLRVSPRMSVGPCRLLRAPAGNRFFPTLSLQVFPRMLEP